MTLMLGYLDNGKVLWTNVLDAAKHSKMTVELDLTQNDTMVSEGQVEILDQVETRASTRSKGNNTSIPIRAEKRIQQLNNCEGNTSKFSLFNNVDNAKLAKAAAACKVSLGNSDANVDKTISILKAKEAAQGALTAAAVKMKEKNQYYH